MTETNNNKPIRVGSRKSELALIQTKYVIAQLQKLYPEKCFEIHTMSTIGDRVLNVSLPKIGEKVYSQEIWKMHYVMVVWILLCIH